MNQGRTANMQGANLEGIVIDTMCRKGLALVNYVDWIKRPQKYGEELLLKNVPYTSIYGHEGRTEFKIKSCRYGEYRIECKWQQVAGSVDEKFPYVYLNCVESLPEKNIIILVDGGGAKDGAVRWLKSAAANKLFIKDIDKNIKVMDLRDFIVWANTNFR